MTTVERIRVDGHVHVGGRFGALASLRPTLDAANIDCVVLVQPQGLLDHSQLRADNDDACVLGIVGWAEVGVRLSIQSLAELDGLIGVRVSGAGPSLTDSSAHDFWQFVETSGIGVSLHNAVPAIHSGQLERILRDHPTTRIRLEHLGGIPLHGDPDDSRAFRSLLALAATFETVTTTWSGFFLNAAPHPYPDAVPFLQRSLEVFGADRVGWSGDINRAGSTTEAYLADLAFILDAQLPADEVTTILGNPLLVPGL